MGKSKFDFTDEMEARKNSLLICSNENPCMVCGDRTIFLDYCYEGRVCSQDCREKMDKLVCVNEIRG